VVLLMGLFIAAEMATFKNITTYIWGGGEAGVPAPKGRHDVLVRCFEVRKHRTLIGELGNAKAWPVEWGRAFKMATICLH